MEGWGERSPVPHLREALADELVGHLGDLGCQVLPVRGVERDVRRSRWKLSYITGSSWGLGGRLKLEAVLAGIVQVREGGEEVLVKMGGGIGGFDVQWLAGIIASCML